MAAQAVCEECCRAVSEDEATVAEDGRRVCVACASAEGEEGRSTSRTARGEGCCGAACAEPAPVASKREMAPARPEPCGCEGREDRE